MHERDPRERDRRGELRDLCPDDSAPSVEAVDEHAAEEAEQSEGQELRDRHHADGEG